MSAIDPPDIRLPSVVAEAGESVVAVLQSHLPSTRAELAIVDLSEVLARMQELGTYDVRRDRMLRRTFDARLATAREPRVVVMLRAIARRIGWKESC
jgi:hypothetical protein